MAPEGHEKDNMSSFSLIPYFSHLHICDLREGNFWDGEFHGPMQDPPLQRRHEGACGSIRSTATTTYASSKEGIEGEDHEETLGTNEIEHHDLERPGPTAKLEMKSQITLPGLPVWSQRSHTTTGNLQVLAVLIRGKICCPRRAHRTAPMSIVRVQANPLYVTL